MSKTPGPAIADAWLQEHEADLSAVRRVLHANPELGRKEFATGERNYLPKLEPSSAIGEPGAAGAVS